MAAQGICENNNTTDIHNHRDALKATIKGYIWQRLEPFLGVWRLIQRNWRNRLCRQHVSIWAILPDNYRTWQEYVRSYRLLIAEQSSKGQLHQSSQIFEFGDKNGHLLAFPTRPIYTPILILLICKSQGLLVEDLQKILSTFEHFYSSLYQSQGGVTDAALHDYLASIMLPTQSNKESEGLEQVTTREEVAKAIASFKLHKSLALDDYPIEWYQMYGELLVPHLL